MFLKIANVERVKKIRDYAFVHFTSVEDARKAMEATDGTKIDGCTVEVSRLMSLLSVLLINTALKAKIFVGYYYMRGLRYLLSLVNKFTNSLPSFKYIKWKL